MSHKTTSQQFINCYVRTHVTTKNKYTLAQLKWTSLMVKYKLFDKSTNTAYPQAFYDEARFLMNQWNKQNKSEQPMYPMGHIPLKKKKNKKQRKRKKKISQKPAFQEQKTPISIIITIQTDSNNKHTLKHKFTKTDTILAVKKVISNELNMTFDTINLYHMTMDCLFEDDKTLTYYRIVNTYEMRHIPPTQSIIKDDDCKKEPLKREKVKIDKDTFIKTSETKKNHYATFPTLSSYANTSSNNDEKAAGLTQEILSEEPSGDPTQRDTLLHILDGVAKVNGKKCVFFDSSKGVTSNIVENSYLSAVDANTQDSAKFVVTLKNLDQFIDKEEEEKTYDKADKLIEIQESLANKTYNPIVDDIRSKLAAAHEVPAERIVIKDVYLNGVGVAYYVKDLTDSEKNKIITKDSGLKNKMQKLFDDYDKCAIHPALFESSYDISMFDKAGNKTFGGTGSKYKVGPPGKEKEYTQPAGWTRYGLKVLGVYDDDKWLHPFQDPGNWYRAYHGTKRESGSNIIDKGFDIKFCKAFVFGKGIYSSPNINTAQGYSRQITIETKKGTKKFWYVLQVAVNPATMNNASLIPNYRSDNPHYIVPSGADMRPYGILIKEV